MIRIWWLPSLILLVALTACAPVVTPAPTASGPTPSGATVVAMEPALTPAPNPAPTSTVALVSTATVAPTAPPTDPPTPTATATDTATPAPPTATPWPTDTPLPTDTPEPTATPTPSVDWRLVSACQLTPCENRGGHSLFITVLDAAGNGIAGVPVLITWEGGSQVVVTGDKPERGPGCTDFPMYGGYTVRIAEGISEVSPVMSSHERESQRCDETNDNVANSYAHYSYEVIFQRTW